MLFRPVALLSACLCFYLASAVPIDMHERDIAEYIAALEAREMLMYPLEARNPSTVKKSQGTNQVHPHIKNGAFVNAQQNYFAAPQQLNSQGIIQGHSHVVIEHLESPKLTTPIDPTKFAFFKGHHK